VSGAGIDPSERARVLLLRGDELLRSGSPESLDEALLAYRGGLEVAREPGVEDRELPRILEERIATVEARLEGRADEEDGESDDGEREDAAGEEGDRPETGGAER
jgi:hypothetical protein